MKNDKNIIIIKRNKRGKHGGGHHGGAWKVAYADFITALMALFLVLWLLAMLSIDSQKGVGKYFRSYTIFEGNEAGGGGKGISVFPGTDKFVELDKIKELKEDEHKLINIWDDKKLIAKELENNIGNGMGDKYGTLKDQVSVIVSDDEIRIEIVEKTESPMFEAGNDHLLDAGKNILKIISHNIVDIPVNLTIEGHTDSSGYLSEEYSNWELAADRANSVRRELLKNGLTNSRITKIISYADTIPIIPDDSKSILNRRVSIVLDIS